MKTGDKVCFRADVIKRLLHDKTTADMRGTVIGFLNDRVARVDTHGTFCNEDGNSVRCIPITNLSVIIEGKPLPLSAIE